MRFRPNQRGIDELVNSRQVGTYLESLGHQVKREIEQEAAQFSRQNAAKRRFQKSIVVHEPVRTPRGQRVTVASKDFAAHIIEYGSANNPAYAPFRKVMRRLGYRLRGGGERR